MEQYQAASSPANILPDNGEAIDMSMHNHHAGRQLPRSAEDDPSQSPSPLAATLSKEAHFEASGSNSSDGEADPGAPVLSPKVPSPDRIEEAMDEGQECEAKDQSDSDAMDKTTNSDSDSGHENCSTEVQDLSCKSKASP